MSRKTAFELESILKEAKSLIEIGGEYFHYKNPSKHYKILNICIFEETEDVCLVYQALYENKIVWVRKLESFLSTVQTESGVVSRFQKV